MVPANPRIGDLIPVAEQIPATTKVVRGNSRPAIPWKLPERRPTGGLRVNLRECSASVEIATKGVRAVVNFRLEFPCTKKRCQRCPVFPWKRPLAMGLWVRENVQGGD